MLWAPLYIRQMFFWWLHMLKKWDLNPHRLHLRTAVVAVDSAAAPFSIGIFLRCFSQAVHWLFYRLYMY